MWLLLTILCAIATLVSVAYFGSLIPALIFLGLSLAFAFKQWTKRGNG
jgi:hypothetical protein